MEIQSTSTQPGAVSVFTAQTVAQPQEQQARALRSERERDDATRANDQVTLSGASRQVAARETGRVVPQTETSDIADKSQERDRVEQARQARIDSRREDQPVPSSVARALETYTQTAVL